VSIHAIGIDVGATDGKQLDVVVMDGSRRIAAVGSRVSIRRLGAVIEDHRPEIVCIDAPPAWAPAGRRSRTAERELKLLGIQCYYTPDRAEGERNPFYAWMRHGMAVFAAAERAGYPRHRAGLLAGTAIEVFPHATATVLAGCLAPSRRSTADKRAWRAAVLRAQHVPIAELRTLDQVDAALAALTGIIALELREPFSPGVPSEGRIVLPARVVPASGYRRCAPVMVDATEPLIRFCACGCGQQPRPGREFRPGHDRRLQVQLERAVAEGERARAELERRGWA
jgi:hypothetical protein